LISYNLTWKNKYEAILFFEIFVYFCIMENKIIKGAARIYYKAYVEGEPLTHETVLECYEAGAQFVIDSQKKRNNCNIPEGISYKTENKTMEDLKKYAKIVENVEKIIKISGFHVFAAGDPSVGINSAAWEIKNDFYFDNKEELEEFRKEIKLLFEFHCGEVTSVTTFEEYQAELDVEEDAAYRQHPVRFLIKDNGNYKQAGSTASYSNNVGDGIHFVLPSWIDADIRFNDDLDERVIKSTDDEYWNIMKEEAGRLEHEIRNEEYRLKNAKRNLKLIQNEFKHGR